MGGSKVFLVIIFPGLEEKFNLGIGAGPVNGYKNAGSYSVTFDGSDVSSRLYFYRLETEFGVVMKKLTLVR